MSAKWRRDGYIKPTSGNSFPKELLFLDTETYQIKPDNVTLIFPLKLGVLIYVKLDKNAKVIKRDVSTFYSLDDFYDMFYGFIKRKKTLYVFGHNIGFDIRVLNAPHILSAKGFISSPPIINERLFIWRLKSDNGNVIFIDTANYAVQSVKQLGKDMGYDKMDVDLEQTNDNDLLNYCIRDTEIVEKFVIKYIQFIHNNDLGKFSVSLASQALLTWRHRFITTSLYIHTNQEVLDIERSAYHGGRVEAYYIGNLHDETYYYLDINSMYPYVMSTSLLPNRLLSFTVSPSIQLLSLMQHDFYFIADVQLKARNNAYPVFPTKPLSIKNTPVNNEKELDYSDIHGYLVFPTGNYRTVLHHSELMHALEHNEITHIYSLMTYNKAIMFNDYVDFFYKQKQMATLAKDNSWRFISKLFLNTLYGKFGQTNVNREFIGYTALDGLWRVPIYNRDTHITKQRIAWFGEIIEEYKDGEATYSFPAIAGAITAECRMLLYSIIKQAGKSNVFYADTDSVITNTTGYNNLKSRLDDNAIGYLKVEHTSDELTIRGAKDYDFGEISKTKGKSAKATNITDNKWSQLQFQSFLSWLNHGGNTPPSATRIEKRRLGVYNKGIVSLGGFVIPFELDTNS